jgi:hypothetical protein
VSAPTSLSPEAVARERQLIADMLADPEVDFWKPRTIAAKTGLAEACVREILSNEVGRQPWRQPRYDAFAPALRAVSLCERLSWLTSAMEGRS